ncbi:MAG: hypothetical protein JXR76_08280 [Deltaproteobacteria bacterium]|nr:hypothetical protein [Deltaproteobacteria bacterium]
MKTRPIHVTALIAGLLILGLSLPLTAQHMTDDSAGNLVESTDSDGPVTGITSDTPLISINADNVPIADALKEICRKARWGLVLDADDALLLQKVTVLLPQKKQAHKVLALVLSQKGLKASLSDGVLHITASPVLVTNASPDRSNDTEPAADTATSIDSDSESKNFVINDLANLKNLKNHFKDKIKQRRKHHEDSDDDGVERVEMGAPIVIAANETVSEAVSIGDSVTIEGRVNREAVAVGGNVLVKKGAYVGRSVTAVGGDVLVEDGATVNGEVVAVGGKVTVEDGATIKGDRVSINVPIPAIGSLAGLVGMGAVFWILAAILRSLVILVVALIIVWIAPGRVNVAKEYLAKKTGWSLLSGLLIMLGTVPAIVLLAVTVIGIPLIPFLLLFLLAVVIFGLSAMFSWFGYWMPVFKNKKSPTGAILLGFLVFLIINMIPVVGGIFLLFASLAAAGATFLSRFGKKSRTP